VDYFRPTTKPAYMKKTLTLLGGIIAILLISSLLIAGKSPIKTEETIKNETACSGLNASECNKKQKSHTPNEMLIESLSGQFLTISPVSY